MLISIKYILSLCQFFYLRCQLNFSKTLDRSNVENRVRGSRRRSKPSYELTQLQTPLSIVFRNKLFVNRTSRRNLPKIDFGNLQMIFVVFRILSATAGCFSLGNRPGKKNTFCENLVRDFEKISAVKYIFYGIWYSKKVIHFYKDLYCL